MANDGSVVIEVSAGDEPELDLDTSKAPEQVVEAAPEKIEAKAEIETPKIEGVEELRAQLENARKAQDVERAGRAAAEAEVAHAHARVAQAHTSVIDSHLAAVE